MTWSLMTQVLLLECTKNVKVKVSFPLLEFSGQFLHFCMKDMDSFHFVWKDEGKDKNSKATA